MINIKDFLGLAYYTSELDQFLKYIDRQNPKLSELSESQRKEKEKYAHIFQLRDDPNQPEAAEKFWVNF
jgi:hypothetical protein